MIGRSSNVLVLGACAPLGTSLVRAALSLGAQVLAADRLRTRLEDLRAQLGQHERLDVAEWDAAGEPGTRKLLADVTRDRPLDAVFWVVSEPRDLAMVSRAAQQALDAGGSGRVAVLVEEAQRVDAERQLLACGERVVVEVAAPDQLAGARLSELLLLAHPPPLRATRAAQRTLVVGDVHGCAQELDDLLRVSGFAAGRDRLVTVGDLVAKGPDSRGVLRRLRELGALAVCGNHDARVLRHRAAMQRGEPPPLLGPAHRVVVDALDASDWALLESLPLWLELPDLDALVVHAGRLPGLPLAQHDPELLLNMRTVDAEGRGSRKPDAGVLWGGLWRGPELTVFGHHAMQGLQVHPHAIGLDTGCVYGGRLTGLWLPERRLVSVPARAEYAPRQ